MTKNEFVRKLRLKLARLPKGDVEERIAFYSEMIDDRMEAGLSEKDAVRDVGSVDSIAMQIKEEIKPAYDGKEDKDKGKLSGGMIALLILASPLLIAAASVVLSLFITLWALVISLWAVHLSLTVAGIGIIVGGAVLCVIQGHIPGTALIGAGIIVFGIGLLFSYPAKAMSISAVYLTRGAFTRDFSSKKNGIKQKITLSPLILGIILVISGLFVAGFAFGNGSWDITDLSTTKYETNVVEISDPFTSIHIDVVTANIEILPSENEFCKVVLYEAEDNNHNVLIKDGALYIEPQDRDKPQIGINFDNPKITVYLPEDSYSELYIKGHTGDVTVDDDFLFGRIDINLSTGRTSLFASATEYIKVTSSTGSIDLKCVSADEIILNASTGRITVSDVDSGGILEVNVNTGKTFVENSRCKSFISTGSTGDISLVDLIVDGRLSVERSTGDVWLDGCDGKDIYIHTDSGDVEGSFVSDKVFIVHTDTGRINVPNTTSGDRCEITTDTGDIKISIVK